MRRYTKVEISVGAFILVGGLALAYLSFTLGGLDLGRKRTYALTARFSSVGELKTGDPVKLAGVNVGEVARIALVDFAAEAELAIEDDVKLPEDTIASIQSAGLLGDAYVSLSPGASDKDLPSPGRIRRTEPAVSLTELLAKYAFGSPISDDDVADDELSEPAAKPGAPAGAEPVRQDPAADTLE
jgi:phospholipid/cholesterol/gamma-HCH transport system substrate-binding protein